MFHFSFKTFILLPSDDVWWARSRGWWWSRASRDPEVEGWLQHSRHLSKPWYFSLKITNHSFPARIEEKNDTSIPGKWVPIPGLSSMNNLLTITPNLYLTWRKDGACLSVWIPAKRSPETRGRQEQESARGKARADHAQVGSPGEKLQGQCRHWIFLQMRCTHPSQTEG